MKTTKRPTAIYTIKDRKTGTIYRETGFHGLEVLAALEVKLGHSDLALTSIDPTIVTAAGMHD